MNHFSIDRFEIIDDGIEVTTQKYGCKIPVYIPGDKFETWLKEKGKLDEVQDISNDTQERDKANLYEYITTNPILFRGTVMENSVASLNIQFELALLQKIPKRSSSMTVNEMPFENRIGYDKQR